jgi:PEP-CTERM motif
MPAPNGSAVTACPKSAGISQARQKMQMCSLRRLACTVFVSAGLSAGYVRGAIITQWHFTSTASAPDNSPSPTTGSGTAITLGMDNSYNGLTSTAADDIHSTEGTATTSFSEDTWRVRGGSPGNSNGWAIYDNGKGAPEYSQGIELDASTAGYQNISFSFDWYSTTQGIRDLQFQYNLNKSNPAGWTNFGGTSPTGTYIAVSNDWYTADGTGANPSTPMITVDLSSLSGANNDRNFGVRLVSAFDSTGNVVDDYASAQLNGAVTQIYNNSSGNWRFDNMTFSGTVPVPEPASLSIVALGAFGLLARRRD